MGDGHLGAVETANRKTGQGRTLATSALFSFIGAVPRTDWLPEGIETDSRGFIPTGPALTRSHSRVAKRESLLLETSRRGVMTAGDVRAGSIKRVAWAVGEEAMAIQLVQEYLRGM